MILDTSFHLFFPSWFINEVNRVEGGLDELSVRAEIFTSACLVLGPEKAFFLN